MPPARPSPATDPGVIDPAAAARFAADLGALRRPPGRLGLAVSGGPDSLALLVLAHAACPGQVEAATVDHGLRPAAAEEAAGVARLCAGLGVPHETLAVQVAPGNVQTEARAARYGALAAWLERRGLGTLLTAHHADDQAETLLLRLNRASGVAGLAGVRAVGVVPGTRWPLLRPLLGWRRHDLAAVVTAAGLPAVDDPSNHDPRFDRARLRMALAGADWLDIAAVARSAQHLAEADAALDWAAAREWQDQVSPGALGSYVYRPQAPRAVALRVLARLIEKLDGTAPRGSAVALVFDALVAGQPASIGGLVARPLPEGWSFAKAPLRRGKSDPA
ncbi:tRNA lysidine(34) synthetase TilS [Novosphingobium piscinae]|uniref:tRNA(Ile)-lysidine synthase n=1 Tax=Novosphingobium piscinae TaxID=1507448 RepID=A0A7X1G171_9SPHN|nr:tRNA lysidine(34) synthetase TilS [Novosphingobium piscinae]MBC2670775.1 tRNA lysidine(34) synthetase TilS [Novosphingobium piscinae]